MNTQVKSKGFTIIEVVLVLAIAALIILMVLIAVPALYRGQRDSARKNDVGQVATAVSTFRSNNRGANPTAAQLGTFDTNSNKWSGYLTAVSNNTTSVTVASSTATATVTQGQALIRFGSVCGAAANPGASPTIAFTAGTTQQFTVSTFVESGGGTVFCQDS